MKAASRAWLGPTNEGPAVRVGPLRVDVRGAVLLEKCEITIRNYGSFPAQDVWTIAKLVVTQIPAKAQEAADAMPAQNTMHPRGIAVFPGSSGQIWERPGQVEPSDRILAKDGRDDFWVYVVGCVLYRDQFGERHHTTFVYGCPKRGTDPDVAFRLDPNTTVETSACIPAGGHIE